MTSLAEAVTALVMLWMFGAIAKEAWWDKRPQIARRIKDEKLGRTLRCLAEERAKARTHFSSGSMPEDLYLRRLKELQSCEEIAWLDSR